MKVKSYIMDMISLASKVFMKWANAVAVAVLMAAMTLVFSGCSASSSYGHIDHVLMETPAAPNIHGAGGYQESGTSVWKATANVAYNRPEKELVRESYNELEVCKSDRNCMSAEERKENGKVDVTYKTHFSIVDATIENSHKINNFLWNWGLGLNQGAYGFLALGFNTKYFEAGGSYGVWLQKRDFRYVGTRYTTSYWYYNDSYSYHEDWFSGRSRVDLLWTYGGYASAYLGPVSLNYSISVYHPSAEYEEEDLDRLQANFELPLVLTEYITLGYRLNEKLELHAGAINVFGDYPGWHWSGTAGLSLYL